MRHKTMNKDNRTGRRARIWHELMLKTDDATLPPATSDGWLTLSSSGRAVQVIDARDDPLTSLLVSEDACWSFAVEDWRHRQPRRWQRAARRAWLGEAAVLVAKRDRLVADTVRLGAHTRPGGSVRVPKLPG